MLLLSRIHLGHTGIQSGSPTKKFLGSTEISDTDPSFAHQKNKIRIKSKPHLCFENLLVLGRRRLFVD
jgi:hypothetical protein